MPLSAIQLEQARKNLGGFQLRKLFLEDLGWMAYKNPSSELSLKNGTAFVIDPVAQVLGVAPGPETFPVFLEAACFWEEGGHAYGKYRRWNRRIVESVEG